MTDAARADAPASPAAPLRVTIGLLLLWTTTTALTLGLASSLHRDRDAQIDFYRYPATFRRMLWIQDILGFAASPAYGAALAATTVAVWRAVRRIGGFPTQPGHWIAVLLGVATLGFFAALVPSSDEPTQRVIAAAVTVFLAVVSCLAAGATSEPRRWLMVLRVAAVGFCGQLAMMVAGLAAQLEGDMPAVWVLLMLPGLAIALAILLAGGATIVDVFRRQRYDLFHWLGLLTLVLLVAHPAIAVALFWYF
jgi:hypothetical protein